LGRPLRTAFTYVIPVLVVINVPARMVVWPLHEQNWPLVAFAMLATAASMAASRWVFQAALASYRSASS
jgi:ABC-2 type transport system permease protein